MCLTKPWPLLALLALSPIGRSEQPAAPVWRYDDRVLTRCDQAWFDAILLSHEFHDFLGGQIDAATIDPVEHAKLALVAAFLPNADLIPVLNVVLRDSNPFAAAALFACLQGYMGDPMQSHHRFKAFADRFAPGAAPDLDAAFFAHIKDEPSFSLSIQMEHLLPLPDWRETNMFAAFAQEMQARSQAYMLREWKRIARFERNARAKAAADKALRSASDCREAEEFSQLVADIRELYRRAGAKRVVVNRRQSEPLPPPFEHLRLTLGAISPPEVRIALTDDDGQLAGGESAVKEGEALPLPQIGGGDYILLFDRLGNLPYRADYAVFVVLPAHVLQAVTRFKRSGDASSIPAAPDPKLFDRSYLAQLVGTYGRWPMRLTVTLDADALMAKGLTDPAFRLIPLRGDEFSLGGTSSGTVRFVPQADGTLVAAIKDRFGNERTWPKR